MSDNKWSVYLHITPASPIHKVYVGITSRLPKNRWGKGGQKYNHSDSHFWRAIQKYGWDNIVHIILESGICELKAKDLEKKLIKVFNSMNPNYGYNLTEGGDGVCGYEFTEESKEKISESQKKRFENPEERIKKSEDTKKYFENPEARIKHGEFQKKRFENPEERKKMSESKKKYFAENPYARIRQVEVLRNHLENPEIREKMRNGQKRAWQNPERHRKASEISKCVWQDSQYYAKQCKKVNQYTLDGIFMKTWNSISEAERTLCITHIVECCKHKPHCKTAGKYKWEYAEEKI
jgi:group I intron endonuclease